MQCGSDARFCVFVFLIRMDVMFTRCSGLRVFDTSTWIYLPTYVYRDLARVTSIFRVCIRTAYQVTSHHQHSLNVVTELTVVSPSHIGACLAIYEGGNACLTTNGVSLFHKDPLRN